MECVHELCMWGLCCKVIIKKCVRFAGKVRSVLASARREGGWFWGHKLQTYSDLRGCEIVLHSTRVGAGKSVGETLYFISSSHAFAHLSISFTYHSAIFNRDFMQCFLSHFSSIWPNSCFPTKNVECHVLYCWTACWLDLTRRSQDITDARGSIQTNTHSPWLMLCHMCLKTQETREILHFHYTTWPDFGVPESPASFLNFLLKVRESGCLSPDHGPVVVHCSAGIGRSGTFCLVDTCLLLVRELCDAISAGQNCFLLIFNFLKKEYTQ